MVKKISEYKAEISKAMSKEHLQHICLDALKYDDECTVFSKKYDKIVELCAVREIELGLE